MPDHQIAAIDYIYDPDRGDRKGKILKGTRFEDLPDDWKCPICGAGKNVFLPLAGPVRPGIVTNPAPLLQAQVPQKTPSFRSARLALPGAKP